MAAPTENESWIIDKGDEIIQKKAAQGFDALSEWEKLVYCLWVADYGMRNAGDLAAASNVYAQYKIEALHMAQFLQLPFTSKAFALDEANLEKEYFSLFEDICNELRAAEGIA